MATIRRKQYALTSLWGGSRVSTYGTVEAHRAGFANIPYAKIRTIAQAESNVWKEVEKHNQSCADLVHRWPSK